MKQADIRDMFKKELQEFLYVTIFVFPDPLSPTPSTSSAMKTWDNTEQDYDDPELGDIQMKYGPD
jgi:hypothetical protein